MHILGPNPIKLNRQQFVCEHCLLQLVFFFHQGSPVCVHFLHDRGHVGNVVLKEKGEILLVYIDEYQRCKLWYLTLASQTSQTFLLIIYVIVTIWTHNIWDSFQNRQIKITFAEIHSFWVGLSQPCRLFFQAWLSSVLGNGRPRQALPSCDS